METRVNADDGSGSDTVGLLHTTPDVEPLSDLITRLQNIECAKPVGIYLSRASGVRPACVEQSELCAVSKYFKACFDPKNPYARFTEADDEEVRECSFSFADYTTTEIGIFLFWLEHHSVPNIMEVDSLSPETMDADYQLLLARAYAFAEDKQIREMQNEIMRSFLLTLIHTELNLPMLQKILTFAQSQSMLRLAVLEEALRLEHDGSELLEGLQTKWVCGIEGDMRAAKTRFDRRQGARGVEGEYFINIEWEE